MASQLKDYRLKEFKIIDFHNQQRAEQIKSRKRRKFISTFLEYLTIYIMLGVFVWIIS